MRTAMNTNQTAGDSQSQVDLEDGQAAHLVPFANHKAGMEKVDKAHVAKVIEAASRGSSYWDEQRRKDKQTETSIATMERKLDQLPTYARQTHASEARKTIARLEAERTLDRIWVVVDMDQFFAAVAIRDNPKLESVPIAVGGMAMISTASYSARRYGVRSAMPGFIARRLCPSLVFVSSNFDAYRAASEQCKAVYRQFDPGVRAASLDEAYLDITEHCARLGIRAGRSASVDEASVAGSGSGTGSGSSWVGQGSLEPVSIGTGVSHAGASAARRAALSSIGEAESRRRDSLLPRPGDATDPSLSLEHRIGAVVFDIRRAVEAATGLTCSAGAGPNPMLAKMASEENKPDGQYVVPFTSAGARAWIQGKGVREVPFVGRVTEKMLASQGVKTVADLEDALPRLWGVLKPAMREALARRSIGVADAEREEEASRRKSISMERTFRSESNVDTLQAILERLIKSLSMQMQGAAGAESDASENSNGEILIDEKQVALDRAAAAAAEKESRTLFRPSNKSDAGLSSAHAADDITVPFNGRGREVVAVDAVYDGGTGILAHQMKSADVSASARLGLEDQVSLSHCTLAPGDKRSRSDDVSIDADRGPNVSPSSPSLSKRLRVGRIEGVGAVTLPGSSGPPPNVTDDSRSEISGPGPSRSEISGPGNNGSPFDRMKRELYLPTGAASALPNSFGSSENPDDVGPRMSFEGRVITIKLKGADFAQVQRQIKLPRYTNRASDMLRAARRLFDRELSSCAKTKQPLRLRLIGVRMSELRFEDERPEGTAGMDHFLKKGVPSEGEQDEYKDNNDDDEDDGSSEGSGTRHKSTIESKSRSRSISHHASRRQSISASRGILAIRAKEQEDHEAHDGSMSLLKQWACSTGPNNTGKVFPIVEREAASGSGDCSPIDLLSQSQSQPDDVVVGKAEDMSGLSIGSSTSTDAIARRPSGSARLHVRKPPEIEETTRSSERKGQLDDRDIVDLLSDDDDG